jgi:Asp-tRNA(Asn)/Glu-tRNA(Gln) amidotransferase A subunit family amidase
VPRGKLNTADVRKPERYISEFYRFNPNTQPFNICGAPAMSVPLAMSKEGLPIGIQFAAATGKEALLFRLAGQLEAERPWMHKIPPEQNWDWDKHMMI